MKKHLPLLFYSLLAFCIYTRAQTPHGKLIYERFTAPSIRGNPGGEDPIRHLSIYLPPDYDKGSRHYPVVYLLHGYNWHDSSTMAVYRFNELIDAAVAAGRIKPFI